MTDILALLQTWGWLIVIVMQALFGWFMWSLKRTFVSHEEVEDLIETVHKRLGDMELAQALKTDHTVANGILLAIEGLRGEVARLATAQDFTGKNIASLDSRLTSLTNFHMER